MKNWEKNYLRFIAVAAINAGIFIAYRLYMHRHHVTSIKAKDFTPAHMLPCLALDFEGYSEHLKRLEFAHVEDDLDNLDIACFKYQDIFCSIQKYKHSQSSNYNVFVDIKGCHKYKKNPKDIALKALMALQLNEIPVSWINMELEEAFNLFKDYHKD